jgi:hypothetical protein
MVDYATMWRRLVSGLALVIASTAAEAAADTPHRRPLVDSPKNTDPFGPNDKLNYLGGRVISNVQVVEVSWGTKVDTTYLAKLADF